MNQNNAININDTIAITEQEAKQRVCDEKLGNISKAKRDELSSKIEMIRKFITSSPQDENTSALLSYVGELEKEIKSKKYGLVFEEHKEDIDEVLQNNIPVLTENKELFVNNGGPVNYLIEGDNLSSLKLLLKTHKSSIDLIYIDPPYNTEKEGFTYSDARVDANDSFRHSKWLSFMNVRLNHAKKLLSTEGVIFISVDENEFAQIKMLCDNVFGEKCFIECLIWNKRVPKNDKGIGNIHEYILLYANNPNYKYKFMMPKDGLSEIYELMEDCKKKNLSVQECENKLKNLYKKKAYDRAITLYNSVDENYRIWGKINMSWPNGNTFGPRYKVKHPITGEAVKIPDRGWRWSESTFNKTSGFNVDTQMYEKIQSRFDGSCMCGDIWFYKDENMQPSSIKYLDDVGRMLLRSIISLKSDGSVELEKHFGEKSVFAYPKSVPLMKLLIDSITYDKHNCTILDFFAGSGTSGQAVLELNQETQKKHRFILCTNNENDICKNVTYERCKRVIENENYKASLKYYKVGYVPVSEKMYYEYADELLLHIRELVELENGIDFNKNLELSIILSDDEADDFFKTTENLNCFKKIYLGHDVLLSGEQEQIIKNNGIELIIIPNYYYKELED